MTPPIAAPPVNPTPPMTIISGPRSRRGLYSPTSAVAFGIMQPSPMPATKRRPSSSPTEAARAAAIVITPKKSVAPIKIGRRPILSASMLKTSDPTSTPKLLAPNTGPSAALETFHSRTISGATYPSACTSKPSMIRHSRQIANVDTCSAPSGLLSMRSAMSTAGRMRGDVSGRVVDKLEAPSILAAEGADGQSQACRARRSDRCVDRDARRAASAARDNLPRRARRAAAAIGAVRFARRSQ